MNAKQASLQTEKISFVTLLTQGLLGGTIGGFFCFAEFAAFERIGRQSFYLLLFTIYISVVIGVIKATLLWVGYCLTGIRIRAAARVAIVSVAATICVSFLGLNFQWRDTDLTTSLIIALLVGTPIALIVGSPIRPLELFTFGSIAVGDSTSEYRAGSKSFWGTLCTYPLRFLSIGTIILIALLVAFEAQSVNQPSDIINLVIFPVIAGGYAGVSAYVTFRSPQRAILLALGVVLNIPVALIGLFLYNVYSHEYWRVNITALLAAVFCGSFVVAWSIFLIARLNTRTTFVSSPSRPDQHFDHSETHLAQQKFDSRSSHCEQAA